MPLGPAQGYLAKYNGNILPGYVQQESMDSIANLAQHPAPYADGSLTENTGLQNKVLSLTLKVWEEDFITCSDQIQLAATILRSKREGFAPLYVQYSDRYYWAMTRDIRKENTAGRSVRLQDYQVEFECKPWLIAVSGHTITGTGTISTDQVSRTIDNGGWTPARLTLTGTNLTVSGYTDDGQLAGFISVSGAATNLIIDSDAFTATISGVNKNNIMKSADYRMFVGPGRTTFVTTGASSCSIEYYDRWYI